MVHKSIQYDKRFRRGLWLGLALLPIFVTACAPAQHSPAVARLLEPEPIRLTAAGPPDARPGSCWGRKQTPAIIETETHQVLLHPAKIADTGEILAPPIYKTESRQRIVRERKELWFETLCDDALTPGFVASLQRALAARALYVGPVSGTLDARTRNAIRRYQRPQGLDSPILSLAAARQLGLVAVARDG